MSKELLDEIRALTNEIKGLRSDANKNAKRKRDLARYDRYCRLKESGNLPYLDAIGRGMPTIPTYSQWNGMSKEEAKRQYDYYNSSAGRL